MATSGGRKHVEVQIQVFGSYWKICLWYRTPKLWWFSHATHSHFAIFHETRLLQTSRRKNPEEPSLENKEGQKMSLPLATLRPENFLSKKLRTWRQKWGGGHVTVKLLQQGVTKALFSITVRKVTPVTVNSSGKKGLINFFLINTHQTSTTGKSRSYAVNNITISLLHTQQLK